MPVVEVNTVRYERSTILADSILALLRGAGFDIPEGAVLYASVGGDQSLHSIQFTHELEPVTQRKKVSHASE